MAKADNEAQGSGAAASFEATIRANARPMLSKEERAEAARTKAALEARWAAARCREAAEAQTARAAEWDAQADKLEKGN